MFDTAKRRPLAAGTSVFMVRVEPRRPRSEVLAEAGRAIESAHRDPAPIGPTVRVAVAIALAMAAALCAPGVFG